MESNQTNCSDRTNETKHPRHYGSVSDVCDYRVVQKATKIQKI